MMEYPSSAAMKYPTPHGRNTPPRARATVATKSNPNLRAPAKILQYGAGMWNHWVGRTCTPHQPFSEFEPARAAWFRIRELFPEMLSAVLMPNHFHLVLPADPLSPKQVTHRLGGFMAGISKENGVRNFWQPTPPPAAIPDRGYLLRILRYIALNPCRKKLCSDPLEWYWSTYRDTMGASMDSKALTSRVARALGESETNFQVRFHGIVSTDQSVSITGTPPPKSATPTQIPSAAILEILAAAAGALKAKPTEVMQQGPLRTLFVHLALRHGWRDTKLLAQITGLTRRSVYRALEHPAPTGMEVADLCLGDPRLRPKLKDWEQIIKNSKATTKLRREIRATHSDLTLP